jgi:hypothetical protein
MSIADRVVKRTPRNKQVFNVDIMPNEAWMLIQHYVLLEEIKQFCVILCGIV